MLSDIAAIEDSNGVGSVQSASQLFQDISLNVDIRIRKSMQALVGTRLDLKLPYRVFQSKCTEELQMKPVDIYDTREDTRAVKFHLEFTIWTSQWIPSIDLLRLSIWKKSSIPSKEKKRGVQLLLRLFKSSKFQELSKDVSTDWSICHANRSLPRIGVQCYIK